MNEPTQNSTAPAAWQPVAGFPSIYELCGSHGRVPLRAAAVPLRQGWTCVYSPLPHVRHEAFGQLAAMGKAILLAPNAFHTLGLQGHARALPGSRVVASARASTRIKRKTGLEVQSLDVLRAALPDHVSLIELPPIRNGEVWLAVRAGNKVAWLVCDAFLNLPQTAPGVLGAIMRLMHMGPDLSISSTFKWLLKDRKAYREWLLARIAQDRPTMLIPSHGRIIDDERLPQRLEDLVRARL